MAFPVSDVVEGIVIHVDDPKNLVSQGGCETIALAGNEAHDEHYFLITNILENDVCLCCPLYSEKERPQSVSNDWVELTPSLKTGMPNDWTDGKSFYFKWQFWKVPITSFDNASSKDNSASDRRFYDQNKTGGLAKVTEHLSKARNPWRKL